MKKSIVQSLNLPVNAKILDLGCGNGVQNKSLWKYQYTGVDQQFQGDHIVQCDMKKYLTSTKTNFDLIIAENSLHFVNYPTILKLLELRLRKNGYIFISSINIPQEKLLSAIRSFEILYWKSFLIHDKPHEGIPKEHDHWVTEILMRNFSLPTKRI
jgi:2-polyprenyl-3-methyl-5-hydroxy-6-metoxy-1,4-benzoquinol methylase